MPTRGKASGRAVLVAAALVAACSSNSPMPAGEGGADEGGGPHADAAGIADSTTPDAAHEDAANSTSDGTMGSLDAADGTVVPVADGAAEASADAMQMGDGAGASDGGAGDAATSDAGAFVCPLPFAKTCGAGMKLCDYQCVPASSPEWGCSPDTCTACVLEPGVNTVACVAGACVVASCTAGFADCDGNADNGCEADLGDAKTCGSCNKACAAGQLCDANTCVSACTFPKVACGASCRDLSSDPGACGSCGTLCEAGPSLYPGWKMQCINGGCQREGCLDGARPCPGVGCGVGPPSYTSCGSTCTNCLNATFPYILPLGTLPLCLNGQCTPLCNAASCTRPGLCAPGYTSCAGACVELNTDASHCGACGNACDGGICVAGACTTLASIQMATMNATDIAVDGVNLYAIDDANNIWQIHRTTLRKTLLASNQGHPYRIATDGSYAYWTSNLGNAVLRAPVGGGSPFQVLYMVNAPTGIAVDANALYWSDSTGTHSAPKAGGGTVANISSFGSTDWLQQDATSLYGGPSNGNGVGDVFSFNKTTGVYHAYDTGPGFSQYWVLGVAIDDVNVYWFGNDSHANVAWLLREPKAGGTPVGDRPLWGSPSDVSMTGEHCAIYWSDGSTIFRSTPGSDIAYYPVMTAANGVTKLVLDDTYVYWIGQGFVGRVPK